jgi:hypothetical protein
MRLDAAKHRPHVPSDVAAQINNPTVWASLIKRGNELLNSGLESNELVVIIWEAFWDDKESKLLALNRHRLPVGFVPSDKRTHRFMQFGFVLDGPPLAFGF